MQAKCAVRDCNMPGFSDRYANCGGCGKFWYFCYKHEPKRLKCNCPVKRERSVSPTQLSLQPSPERKLKQSSPLPLCPSPEDLLFPIPENIGESDWYPGSVGIEFEINNIKLNFADTDEAVDSKVLVHAEDDVLVESDSGHVEMVTKYLTIPPRGKVTILHLLKKQFLKINKMVGKQGTLIGKVCTHILPEQEFKNYKNLMGREVKSTHSDDLDAGGKLQVTLSVELWQIPKLLKCKFVNEGKLLADMEKYSFKLQTEAPSAYGLLCLCYVYYHTFRTCLPSDTDGPKQNLMLMCRNDFHSMYKLLKDAEKKIFEKEIKSITTRLNDQILFPNGYDMEGDKISPLWSITYFEWLNSIISPLETAEKVRVRLYKVLMNSNDPALQSFAQEHLNDNWRCKTEKDLLSPPPFFDCSPGNDFCYAMGKYKTTEGRVIVEVRGMHGSRAMNPRKLEWAWEETVELVRLMFEKKPEKK